MCHSVGVTKVALGRRVDGRYMSCWFSWCKYSYQGCFPDANVMLLNGSWKEMRPFGFCMPVWAGSNTKIYGLGGCSATLWGVSYHHFLKGVASVVSHFSEFTKCLQLERESEDSNLRTVSFPAKPKICVHACSNPHTYTLLKGVFY